VGPVNAGRSAHGADQSPYNTDSTMEDDSKWSNAE